MSVLPSHALRAIRQRGLGQFFLDGMDVITEQAIQPKFRPYFENQALHEDHLAEICAAEGTFFARYGSRETHTLSLPTTPNGYPTKVRDQMLERFSSGMQIDAPFVCEIDDVDLVGPDAVAVTHGGYVFENSLQYGKRLTTSCLRSLQHGVLPVQSQWLRPNASIETAVSLVGPWADNYTHWFQDFLTRLEGVEYYQATTGENPILLVPGDASVWMKDALRAVGYSEDNWVEWPGGRVKVDRLIVSSVRREAMSEAEVHDRRRIYSPTGIRWLRDRILANVEPVRTCEHSKRVYISRANALKRRVVNEDRVMDLLEEFEFNRYQPEELSFAEQVTLFSNAEAIVAPHGSGLMNQMFADDAVVVELMGKKQTVTSPATEYYYAELLGHEYGCVPGEPVGPDVRADVEGLDMVLQKLLD
jgi:capsular polysaccharide biosynthesis protein